MAEETQKGESAESVAEDLSKLKVPARWKFLIALVSLFGMMEFAIIWVDVTNGDGYSPFTILCAVACFAVFLVVLCLDIAGSGPYTLHRWKTADGRWSTTSKGYPATAEGFVIETQIGARRSFSKLRFGPKGWHLSPDRGWFISAAGERIQAVVGSSGALEAEGLTLSVVEFMDGVSRSWTIVSLEAGRRLRLIDYRGWAIDLGYRSESIDLGEILKSVDCAEYHKRMQGKARELDAAREKIYAVLAALGMPQPVFDEMLVARLSNVEEAGARLILEREALRAQLAGTLPALRATVKQCRPGTNARALTMARLAQVLNYMHETLPEESPLRIEREINATTVAEADKALLAEMTPQDANKPPAKA